MEAPSLLGRAMSASGKKTKYESRGRMPPFEAAGWPKKSRCDCSGFVNWYLRLFPNRKVDHPLSLCFVGPHQ